MQLMKLSVTIITLNEQHNIARAIKSVSFADEVIVVDSGSHDETCTIAEQLGAKVFQRKFDGYGQQKNYAARQAKGYWIFNLDADEEVSPELAHQLKNWVEQKTPQIAMVNRLTQFCGKWIHHGGWSPDWVARVYPNQSAHFTEPQVHEKVVGKDASLPLVQLEGRLLHYSFPTVSSQVQTNVKYAGLGATALQERKKSRSLFQLVTRPWVKFLECYVWKRGFLDGQAGFIIAVNAAHSQFMKYAIARTSSKGPEE